MENQTNKPHSPAVITQQNEFWAKVTLHRHITRNSCVCVTPLCANRARPPLIDLNPWTILRNYKNSILASRTQQMLTSSVVIFIGNRNFSGVNKNRSGSNNNTPWRNTPHQCGMKSVQKGVFLFLFPDWSLEGSTALSSALSMEYAEWISQKKGRAPWAVLTGRQGTSAHPAWALGTAGLRQGTSVCPLSHWLLQPAPNPNHNLKIHLLYTPLNLEKEVRCKSVG